MMKQFYEKEEIDFKQTLISALTELGMGHLLKNNKVLKEINKQDKIISKSEASISKIKRGVGTANGKMKRIKSYEIQRSNAKKNKQFWEGVDNVFNKTKEKASTAYTVGIYKKNKDD